jgi:WD40 repeat protein
VNRRERVGVALSPCLRFLATGSEDKSARIVDLVSGSELVKLTGFRDVVSSVAFNPLHPQLAAASFEGGIKFYCDSTFGASATPCT